MNKLYQPVLDKIEELGETKAAEYFEKSRQTIYSYKKNPKNIPLMAVQKVIDESEKLSEKDSSISDKKDDKNPQETSSDIKTPIVRATPLTPDWVEDIERRLEKLENFARLMTDPDRAQPQASSIRPATPAQPVGAQLQPTKEIQEVPPAPTPVRIEGWNAPRPVKKS